MGLIVPYNGRNVAVKILIRAYDPPEHSRSGQTAGAIARYLEHAGDIVWQTAQIRPVEDARAWGPDLIIGQQWATEEANQWATALGIPFVMLVYGLEQYEQFMPQCDLVVFQSDELRDAAAKALGPTPAAVLPGVYVVPGEDEPRERQPDAGADFAQLRDLLLRIVSTGRRRPTLTLCMTVANEAQTLEQAVASVAPQVDDIVIGVDERSSDETAEMARRLATDFFTYVESSPPHFPRMRNRAMERVRTDWAIVLDGHEWIENAEALRPALETTAWSIEIMTLYEPDENRIPGLAFPFPRIHRRHVRFVGAPAHEEVNTPLPKRDSRPEIKVWHERKPGQAAATRTKEKTGVELDALRQAWEEGGDRRALFYLANGLRDAGRFEEAIQAYTTYLEEPAWAEEGWQARLYLARSYVDLQDWQAARREAEAAVLFFPDRAEALVLLGYILMELDDLHAAAAWFRMAASLPIPTRFRLFVEVPMYRWGAWHGLALALERLGDFAGAVEAEERAVAGGAGQWALQNVDVWRARAGSGSAAGS